jgi:hypothetical protein
MSTDIARLALDREQIRAWKLLDDAADELIVEGFKPGAEIAHLLCSYAHMYLVDSMPPDQVDEHVPIGGMTLTGCLNPLVWGATKHGLRQGRLAAPVLGKAQGSS